MKDKHYLRYNATRSINRKIRNAQKVVFDGVQFASKLELFTYKELKATKVRFTYEGERFILLDKFKYYPLCLEKTPMGKDLKLKKQHIHPITFLPDFLDINEENKTGWVMEVKGYPNDAFPLRWKLFKYYLFTNGYNVELFLPKNQRQVLQAINIIKKNFYDNKKSNCI